MSSAVNTLCLLTGNSVRRQSLASRWMSENLVLVHFPSEMVLRGPCLRSDLSDFPSEIDEIVNQFTTLDYYRTCYNMQYLFWRLQLIKFR